MLDEPQLSILRVVRSVSLGGAENEMPEAQRTVDGGPTVGGATILTGLSDTVVGYHAGI